MKIDVLTLFPEMFAPLKMSIIGRAENAGLVEINTVNIRDYTLDRHSKCDDVPYGGGAGMVMTPQPIVDCVRAVDPEGKSRRIYMSPRGKILTVDIAKELAGEQNLLFLCGHYEGVDERALEICGFEELSIGDYVLTGGELPAMVTIDALLRFVSGVLGSEDSAMDESFSDGMLEYPQYTRPAVYEGKAVPEVLLSGHHANIERWRREKSREITEKYRPDLIKDDN
ncbi:MAG: tRNA (guanosine(37)-N1)-methyltransferase TrmD [Clostridia bacterium]|nr:tRNA (guanosine(37)-N1)-methyltransferase TrmD [Clostridia bacterium]